MRHSAWLMSLDSRDFLHSNQRHLFEAGKIHFQVAGCSFLGLIMSCLVVNFAFQAGQQSFADFDFHIQDLRFDFSYPSGWLTTEIFTENIIEIIRSISYG